MLLALALPPLFTHIDFQPTASVGALTIQLADVAIVVAAAYALLVYRSELPRLWTARAVWIATAALFLWILAACFYPLLWQDGYRVGKHVVSALKWQEYALLAVVPALVLRARRDVQTVLCALAAWAAVAAVVAVSQFLGAGWFDAWGAGSRQPSFVGTHDLAALAGAALLAGLVALVAAPQLFPDRRFAWLSVGAGAAGFVLGGATAGALGLVLACFALLLATRARRAVLVVATVAVCVAGVVAIRS